MAAAALQIVCALLYANLGEWLMHKYLLHGLGKKPGSIWAYHWYEHHRVCAEHGMLDPGYRSLKWSWNAQTKELVVLAAIVALHMPLFFFMCRFSPQGFMPRWPCTTTNTGAPISIRNGPSGI